MKRIYTTPQIEVVEMELQPMMAASNEPKSFVNEIITDEANGATEEEVCAKGHGTFGWDED